MIRWPGSTSPAGDAILSINNACPLFTGVVTVSVFVTLFVDVTIAVFAMSVPLIKGEFTNTVNVTVRGLSPFASSVPIFHWITLPGPAPTKG